MSLRTYDSVRKTKVPDDLRPPTHNLFLIFSRCTVQNTLSLSTFWTFPTEHWQKQRWFLLDYVEAPPKNAKNVSLTEEHWQQVAEYVVDTVVDAGRFSTDVGLGGRGHNVGSSPLDWCESPTGLGG